jgi:hypothetical protein
MTAVAHDAVETEAQVLEAASPADEIVAYADSVDADLIVFGSRGHGAVAGALLGSVSRGGRVTTTDRAARARARSSRAPHGSADRASA